MNYNVLLAERAIDYVHNTVRIKSGNRHEGINRLQGARAATENAVTQMRQLARQQFVQHNLQPGIGEADIRAQVAAWSKVGNCTEQSALVFEYLRERRHRGIAMIGLPNHNHMFVVLGLMTRPPATAFFCMGEGAPLNWGPNAVVCDPWYHDWFVAQADWDRKINYILQEAMGGVAPGTWCKLECRAYV